MKNQINLVEIKRYIFAIFGTLLFSIGVNQFIVPLGLYNGGFVGISQIIKTLLTEYLNISFGGFNISGTIYFLLNLPLFIVAYRFMGREFFLKTVVCVIFQTIFLSAIPIALYPVIDDPLAACLIGGILAGCGIGLTLIMGGSTGGGDILGVYYSKKYSSFSVGKLALMINVFVYGVCALLFDLNVVIYSVIYTTFLFIVVDKVHSQNIKTEIMIVTKSSNLPLRITKEMERGVTTWKAKGAYTGEPTNIVYTIISKYEVNSLKRIIKEEDTNAFYVMHAGMDVGGNFEKRL